MPDLPEHSEISQDVLDCYEDAQELVELLHNLLDFGNPSYVTILTAFSHFVVHAAIEIGTTKEQFLSVMGQHYDMGKETWDADPDNVPPDPSTPSTPSDGKLKYWKN